MSRVYPGQDFGSRAHVNARVCTVLQSLLLMCKSLARLLLFLYALLYAQQCIYEIFFFLAPQPCTGPGGFSVKVYCAENTASYGHTVTRVRVREQRRFSPSEVNVYVKMAKAKESFFFSSRRDKVVFSTIFQFFFFCFISNNNMSREKWRVESVLFFFRQNILNRYDRCQVSVCVCVFTVRFSTKHGYVVYVFQAHRKQNRTQLHVAVASREIYRTRHTTNPRAFRSYICLPWFIVRHNIIFGHQTTVSHRLTV